MGRGTLLAESLDHDDGGIMHDDSVRIAHRETRSRRWSLGRTASALGSRPETGENKETSLITPLEEQLRRFQRGERATDSLQNPLKFAKCAKGVKLASGGLAIKKTRHGDSFALTMPSRHSGRTSATFRLDFKAGNDYEAFGVFRSDLLLEAALTSGRGNGARA